MYFAASGVRSRGPKGGLDWDLFMLPSAIAGSVNRLPASKGNMRRRDWMVEWGNPGFFRQGSPSPSRINVPLISNNIRLPRLRTADHLEELLCP